MRFLYSSLHCCTAFQEGVILIEPGIRTDAQQDHHNRVLVDSIWVEQTSKAGGTGKGSRQNVIYGCIEVD